MGKTPLCPSEESLPLRFFFTASVDYCNIRLPTTKRTLGKARLHSVGQTNLHPVTNTTSVPVWFDYRVEISGGLQEQPAKPKRTQKTPGEHHEDTPDILWPQTLD